MVSFVVSIIAAVAALVAITFSSRLVEVHVVLRCVRMPAVVALASLAGGIIVFLVVAFFVVRLDLFSESRPYLRGFVILHEDVVVDSDARRLHLALSDDVVSVVNEVPAEGADDVVISNPVIACEYDGVVALDEDRSRFILLFC